MLTHQPHQGLRWAHPSQCIWVCHKRHARLPGVGADHRRVQSPSHLALYRSLLETLKWFHACQWAWQLARLFRGQSVLNEQYSQQPCLRRTQFLGEHNQFADQTHRGSNPIVLQHRVAPSHVRVSRYPRVSAPSRFYPRHSVPQWPPLDRVRPENQYPLIRVYCAQEEPHLPYSPPYDPWRQAIAFASRAWHRLATMHLSDRRIA